MIRIAIADDHALVRSGLNAVISAAEDMEVQFEACSGVELFQALTAEVADVVVLDQSMPGGSGLQFLRELKRIESAPRVVLLTATTSGPILKEALKLGAVGLVSKNESSERLINAIRKVHQGDSYISAEFIDQVNSESRFDELTPRELQVLVKLLEGATTKAVSEQLNISYSTADTHRTNIMKKLNVHTVVDLVRVSVDRDILSSL